METLPTKQESNLPSSHQDVINAMTHDLIKDLSDPELRSTIANIHGMVNLIMQHNKSVTREDLAAFHQEIFLMLRSDFKGLTAAEIKLAAQKGARGLLKTDDVHFSVRTLARWIKAYQEAKKAVILNLKALEQPRKEKKMTDQEKMDSVESFYQTWLAGNVKGGFCSCYRIAKEIGLIKVNGDQIRLILKEAKEIYLANHSGSSEKIQRIHDQKAMNLLNQFLHNDGEIPGELQSECQKLTLIKWFEELRDFETSPKEITLK